MNQAIRDYPWLLTVIEWLQVIITVLLIPVALFLIYMAVKYIRFIAVRIKRISDIKKICRRSGAAFTADRPFRSIWKNNGRDELSINGGDKTYNIKLIGCSNPKAGYYLDGLDYMAEILDHPDILGV